MRGEAVKSVRWTAGGNILRSVLATVQLLIIARLVPVADFGLIVLVVSLLTLAQNISDAGLSSALIRFRDVSDDEKSSLFWLNAAIGVAMALLTNLAAPLLAGFYHAPSLDPMLRIASIVFVANGLWLQFRVLAEREMRFDVVIKLEVASSVLGFLVSVGLAFQGMGALSVVWGQVATSLSLLVLAWWALSKEWRPKLHFRPRDVARFVSYGMDMLLVNVATSITVQLDILIAGAFFSKPVFGSFSQPRDLNMKVMTAINPVITRVGLPLMAKHQNDPKAAGRVYLKMIRMSSSVCFPLYAGMGFLAQDVLPQVLGRQWTAAAALFPYIALWFALRSVINPLGSFLVALGKSRLALYYQAAFAVIIALFAFVGAKAGPVALSLSMAGAYLLFAEVSWVAVLRPNAGVSFVSYHRQFAIPAICAGGGMLVAWLVRMALGGNVGGLAAAVALGGIVFVALNFVLNREGVDEVLGLVRMRARVVG